MVHSRAKAHPGRFAHPYEYLKNLEAKEVAGVTSLKGNFSEVTLLHESVKKSGGPRSATIVRMPRTDPGLQRWATPDFFDALS
jgi:hypothetical protein